MGPSLTQSKHLLDTQGTAVASVVYSPKGGLLAIADDTMIRLWDVAEQAVVKTLANQRSPVRCLAFSPDGELLASGDDMGTIQLWDTTTWRSVRVETRTTSLAGADGPYSLTFTSDGKQLVGSFSRTIAFWDIVQTRASLNSSQ